MSEGKPHEGNGDTQEFKVLRGPEGVNERTEFELVGDYRLSVRAEFQHPIELRLGRDDETPTFFLVRQPARDSWRRWDYAVVQPEVVRAHPGRGWVEGSVDVIAYLGRGLSPQFELGQSVSRHHCMVAEHDTEDERFVEIENWGRNGMRVLVHPDDFVDIQPFERDADMWPDS
jgi:hypothetical protein